MVRGPGRKFEKGNCANPGGRPKTDPLVKEFRATTYKDFIIKLQKYGSFTKEELKEIVDNPTTKSFDLIFIRILYDAMAGKSDARQVLLERLWGKVKDNLALEIEMQSAHTRDDLRKLPLQELLQLVRKAIPEDISDDLTEYTVEKTFNMARETK